MEALHLLLDAGGEPNKADDAGFTPMYGIAHEGKVNAVRMLLEAGGDPDKGNQDGLEQQQGLEHRHVTVGTAVRLLRQSFLLADKQLQAHRIARLRARQAFSKHAAADLALHTTWGTTIAYCKTSNTRHRCQSTSRLGILCSC